jgi:hypothetical protein
MKKLILSAAAAFCGAIGVSSFNIAHLRLNPYYYFTVNGGSGNKIKFFNASVTYYGKFVPISNPCVPAHLTPSYLCLIGFTSTQVTSTNHSKLFTIGLGGQPQPPWTVPYYRTAP